MSRTWLGLVGALGLVSIAAAGCKEKPIAGASCIANYELGTGECQDPSTFLVCDTKTTFIAVPCKGKKGCYGTGPGKVAEKCDVSGNADGDPCALADWNHKQCAEDGKSLVVCAGPPPKFRVLPCLGPNGCRGTGVATECDQSAARAGDACNAAATQVLTTCSEDKKTMLRCGSSQDDKQTWVAARTCRGPNGCTSAGKAASCDSSIAQPGDPCDKPNMAACSADGKAKLVCKDGVFAEAGPCAGPDGCKAKPLEDGGQDVTCSAEPAADPSAAHGGVADGGAAADAAIADGGATAMASAVDAGPTSTAGASPGSGAPAVTTANVAASAGAAPAPR